MEYTLLSIAALILSSYYALYIAKLDRTNLALTCAISVFFQLIFDNLMTSLGLWSFDFSYTVGLAVPVIPIENLLFGTSLAIATIASYERMLKGSEEEPEISYFGVQAYMGSTKHGGGQDSTDDLIRLCKIKEGSRVLDVGCGPGLTAIQLARMGCDVTAVDLNSMMVERARENASSARADARFLVADARKLPFKAGEFDAAISESVIVFVPGRDKAMKELVRVVKPGGCIGLNEIYWRKKPPEDIRAKVTELYDLKEDIPDLDGWKGMLKAAGLEDIKAEPHNLVDRRALSRMKRVGIPQMLRIMWRTIYGYARFPGFRDYMHYMARLPKSFPDYLGYGILAGRKRG